MESSGEPLPIETRPRCNRGSSVLDRFEGRQPDNETQQITGASAADESAIISAARGIGSINNSRTNIKQAFVFVKRVKLSDSEPGSTSIIDDRSTISTRTASLDGYEASPRYKLHRTSSSSELGLSEKSSRESSRALVATSNRHIQHRKRPEFISCNRTPSLAILALVLLCVVTVTIVSVFYVTHILPRNADSSASLRGVSSVSSPPVIDSVPTFRIFPSSTSTSVTTTSESVTPSNHSSSRATISGETTTAQPSTTSSLPSSTTSSSSASSTPLSPAPTPVAPSFATSSVPATVVSTCDWGCYGWDCGAKPCNSLWQCINGYCKSSTITSAAAATSCVWYGGNLGNSCGNDNCCSDPYTCLGGTCKTQEQS